MQIMPCAFVFALANAGKSKPARIAIMAITTSNSINVKPPRRHNFRDLPGILMVFISKLFFGDLINKITNHRKLSEFSGGRRNGQLCVPAHRDFLTVGVAPTSWFKYFENGARTAMSAWLNHFAAIPRGQSC